MQVILAEKSGNRKTGKIPVSMTEQASCPPVCRLHSACYARGGKGLALTWWRLSEGRQNGLSWERFCNKVEGFKRGKVHVWRHNQAGDMPGSHNRMDRDAAMALVAANHAGGWNRHGFTYTHYSPVPCATVTEDTAAHNAAVISDMLAGGFAVNLSADSAEHADQLASLGIGPVVTLLPEGTEKGFRLPSGRIVVICPALRGEVQCINCSLCSNLTRKVIVGFPAHGFAHRRASIIAETAGPL